jgi:hypothetical protein
VIAAPFWPPATKIAENIEYSWPKSGSSCNAGDRAVERGAGNVQKPALSIANGVTNRLIRLRRISV